MYESPAELLESNFNSHATDESSTQVDLDVHYVNYLFHERHFYMERIGVYGGDESNWRHFTKEIVQKVFNPDQRFMSL